LHFKGLVTKVPKVGKIKLPIKISDYTWAQSALFFKRNYIRMIVEITMIRFN